MSRGEIHVERLDLASLIVNPCKDANTQATHLHRNRRVAGSDLDCGEVSVFNRMLFNEPRWDQLTLRHHLGVNHVSGCLIAQPCVFWLL
jgi:hypothetical protein